MFRAHYLKKNPKQNEQKNTRTAAFGRAKTIMTRHTKRKKPVKIFRKSIVNEMAFSLLSESFVAGLIQRAFYFFLKRRHVTFCFDRL